MLKRIRDWCVELTGMAVLDGFVAMIFFDIEAVQSQKWPAGTP